MNVNLNTDIVAQLKQVNFRRLIYVRRYLLISIVMCITALCIAVLAILPQVEQIISTQGMIQAENTTLSNLQRKIQGLAQVNDLAEYANKDKVDEALPFQKPLLPMLETSRRVSIETGARILSFETTPGRLASISAQRANAAVVNATGSTQPQQVPTPLSPDADQVHGVDKMDLSVTVQGTLAQISNFITGVESSTPITSVTEIRLTGSQRPENGPPEFSAALRLSSYYFTRAIEVAIDAPLPETGARERAFLQELENYTIGASVNQSDTVQGGGQEDLFGIRR